MDSRVDTLLNYSHAIKAYTKDKCKQKVWRTVTCTLASCFTTTSTTSLWAFSDATCRGVKKL